MKTVSNKRQSIKIRQQLGAALLIAMVVLASVAAFYLMGKFGAVSQKLDRQDSRIQVLGEAKKALIDYAVSYIDEAGHEGEYGFLPCPDYNVSGLPEGEEEGFCYGAKNESVIGRLPWRSLDLPMLKDDSNECLWYAVSGAYKNSNNPAVKTDLLNEDTNGLFQIHDAAGNLILGANPEDRVVAVVIAPSNSIAGQTRSPLIPGITGSEMCGGHYTVTDYLEGNGVYDNGVLNGTPDTVDQFIRSGTKTPFNDKIITITRDEIWDAVKRRRGFLPSMRLLTKNIAACVTEYGNMGNFNNLPWPAAIDLGGNDYRDDASYADLAAPANLFGRLPESVANSEAQLDANPGGGAPGIGGQFPPTGGPACTDCWVVYQLALTTAQQKLDDAIAVANRDFASCRRSSTACNSQLRNDLRDAQRDYDRAVSSAVNNYNNCLSSNTCTPGTGGSGGGGGTCVDCQANYDATVAAAATVLDQAITTAEAIYRTCRRAGGRNNRRTCRRTRDASINAAQNTYDAAVSQAQADLGLCIANNSCGTGGSKGINNILNTCLAPADLELWRHWKDHFFYVVSPAFAPDSTNVSCAASVCVTTTDAAPHAAIIMFAGERVNGALRNGPVVTGDPVVADDADTKQFVSNYLIPENDGSNTVYDAAPGNAANAAADADYLYCINDGVDLVAAPCTP